MTTLTGPITACFYSGNENNPACKQLGGTCIRMTGKRASPKVRSCCSCFGVLLVLSCLLVCGMCKRIAADDGCLSHAMQLQFSVWWQRVLGGMLMER